MVISVILVFMVVDLVLPYTIQNCAKTGIPQIKEQATGYWAACSFYKITFKN